MAPAETHATTLFGWLLKLAEAFLWALGRLPLPLGSSEREIADSCSEQMPHYLFCSQHDPRRSSVAKVPIWALAYACGELRPFWCPGSPPSLRPSLSLCSTTEQSDSDWRVDCPQGCSVPWWRHVGLQHDSPGADAHQPLCELSEASLGEVGTNIRHRVIVKLFQAPLRDIRLLNNARFLMVSTRSTTLGKGEEVSNVPLLPL